MLQPTYPTYDELADWYQLLDPREDHADDMPGLAAMLRDAADGPVGTLLELGAGGGNAAFYLQHEFELTLSDLSPSMLRQCEAAAPNATFEPGDMRSLRLERTFDAVLIRDAIVYMATRDDLAAALSTARVHLRPGGAALFCPDVLRESFAPSTECSDHASPDGTRQLHTMMATWDPDPSDEQYRVDFAFLARDGATMRALHDTHIEGLFGLATWVSLCRDAGFDVDVVQREVEDGAPYCPEMFLCTAV